jgi:tRNA pseudouridine38-40 synthase
MSTPDAPDDLSLEETRNALNAMCGPAISVHSCRAAPEGFHARFSARSRTYVYAVLNSPVGDPWLARTAFHNSVPLDVERMNEAAGHLVGPHDFRSFGRVADPDASAERVLYELRCEREGDLIRIRARANAFIHQMVRSLVGTLMAVGDGRKRPEEMPGVLAAGDRSAAGPVAPPHGLCLVAVEYDDGWGAPPARAV